MPSEFAYWNIRGFGQPIRLLLEYVGEDYVEVTYNEGTAPDYDRKEWLSIKPTLPFAFPNLPYYKDDTVKMTQSLSIMRYLGRKHNISGATLAEQAETDMLLEQVKDLIFGQVLLCYSPQHEENLPDYKKNLPAKLALLEKYLGDKRYLTGDEINPADFLFYEGIDVHRPMIPECLDDFPKIQAYLKRFEALPAIKRFMESPKYIKYPIWSSYAYWGFK